ncbi:MAG TPA: gfo/Idh/MocA family oxidoreductase, partial [Allosphingosinicella sp.]
SNKQTPIAASIDFVSAGGAMTAEMDWRYSEGERWTIRVETSEGQALELLNGGETLIVEGREQAKGGLGEYPAIYDRFAALIEGGESEVDAEPLRIVADAFLVGKREMVEPFA